MTKKKLIYEDDTVLILHKISEGSGDESFETHRHYCPEILFILSGDISYGIGNESVRLPPRSLVLTPPNIYHGLTVNDANKIYERYDLIFKKSPDLGDISGASPLCFDCTDFPIVESAFTNFDMVPALFGPDWEKAAGKLFPVYADEILYYVRNLPLPRILSRKTEDGKMSEILAFLDSDLGECRDLKELSRRFFLSETTLYSLFRERLKTSPGKYLLSRKMDKAMVLLSGGTCPTEVAELVGFRDYSSFYRAFVREFHVAPRDFKSVLLRPTDLS